MHFKILSEDATVGAESTTKKIGESHPHLIKVSKLVIKINYYSTGNTHLHPHSRRA